MWKISGYDMYLYVATLDEECPVAVMRLFDELKAATSNHSVKNLNRFVSRRGTKEVHDIFLFALFDVIGALNRKEFESQIEDISNRAKAIGAIRGYTFGRVQAGNTCSLDLQPTNRLDDLNL